MPKKTSTVSHDDRIWGVLSYLWILSFVALALKKNNSFVRFHANQGVLLFVISLVGIIPIFGWIVSVIVCILAVLGIIKAYAGEKWELPLIAKPAAEFGDWIIKTLKI